MAVAKKKKVEEIVNSWEDRLVRGYASRYKMCQRWKLLLDYYKGNYLPPGKLIDDAVVVNWLLSNVRQMLAALYFQSPRFFIQGLTPRGSVVAPILEGVYRIERNFMNKPREERKVLFNALLYGTGIMLHGYNAEYSPTENPWRSGSVPKDAKEDAEAAFPSGAMTEYQQYALPGHPWVKSVNPFCFLADPEANSPEEARWYAEIINRPWIDCVQDERWDKEMREKLAPTGQGEWSLHADSRDTKPEQDDEDSSLVTLYRIWDRPSQSMYIWAPGLERPLYYQHFPWFGPTGPYRFLQFFPTGDGFWAMPYAWTFAGQAEVMNKLRTQMFDHFQRWGQIRGAYLTGRITPEEVSRFMRNPNALTPVMALGDQKIGDIIQMFPSVPINADTWNLVNMFKGDMNEVSGIDEMTRGSGSNVNLATVANYIQQQAGLRQNDLRHIVEEFLTDSARHDITMLRTFWGAERVVPIVGDDGRIWDAVELTNEEVNYEVEINVEPGSTERIDRTIRARQANEAMAQLSNLMPVLQQAGYTFDWPRLIKTYLHNADFMPNADQLVIQIPPQPPQAAQQTAGAQSQTPSPQNVTMMGAMNPQQQNAAFAEGRMLSEGAQ